MQAEHIVKYEKRTFTDGVKDSILISFNRGDHNKLELTFKQARKIQVFLEYELSVINDGECPKCDKINLVDITCDGDYFGTCACGHRFKITRGCYIRNRCVGQ